MKSESSTGEQDIVKVSVIVPFYNAAETIERCINALLAQNYPADNYEVILVDNNSTDNTAQIVKKYPRIKLLTENKQGSYAARNRGVAESKGGIIAFTDSDCVPAPEWLNRILESFDSSQVGIVQGGRIYASECSALTLLEAYESERVNYMFSSTYDGLYYGYTNNMAVRREIFYQCGPFEDVARGGDSIFVSRAILMYSSEVVRYVPDAAIRHLEITSVRKYLSKKFLYGKSFQQTYSLRKQVNKYMAFVNREEVIKITVQRNSYSLLETLYLIILTRAEAACFISGRLSIMARNSYEWLLKPLRKQHERRL